MAVPTARVSKKPEVFPGKMACAIVEKMKADNPKPASIVPVTVVLCIQEYGEHNHHHRSRINTDNPAGKTFRDSIQRRDVPCTAADPGEKFE